MGGRIGGAGYLDIFVEALFFLGAQAPLEDDDPAVVLVRLLLLVDEDGDPEAPLRQLHFQAPLKATLLPSRTRQRKGEGNGAAATARGFEGGDPLHAHAVPILGKGAGFFVKPLLSVKLAPFNPQSYLSVYLCVC